MRELYFLKSNFNLFRLCKTVKCREWTVSPFHGIHLFCGNQGSGKTLTLTRFIRSMIDAAPQVKVLSNVNIGDIEHLTWDKPDELISFIKNSGLRGAIVVVDEANVVFPSTDKPDKRFLELVCMLRHYEIYLVLTAQRLQRVSKFIREQLTYVTMTSIPFKGLSWNKTYIVDTEAMLHHEDAGEVMKALKQVDLQIYFHHVNDYKRYDSHATIKLLED